MLHKMMTADDERSARKAKRAKEMQEQIFRGIAPVGETPLVTEMENVTRCLVSAINGGDFACYELFNCDTHDDKHELSVVDYRTGLKLSVTIERVT